MPAYRQALHWRTPHWVGLEGDAGDRVGLCRGGRDGQERDVTKTAVCFAAGFATPDLCHCEYEVGVARVSCERIFLRLHCRWRSGRFCRLAGVGDIGFHAPCVISACVRACWAGICVLGHYCCSVFSKSLLLSLFHHNLLDEDHHGKFFIVSFLKMFITFALF